jgi:glycosyltransferase involved in cell wall biosynthesis
MRPWAPRETAKGVIAFIVGLRWSAGWRHNEEAIVHVHAGWVSGPAVTAWVIGHALGVPASATAHRGDILQRAPAQMLRSMALVRSISERARQKLQDASIPSVVVPLGALRPVATPANEPLGRPIRCVTIGALIGVKGHDRAVETIARARAQGIDVTLDIIGEGPLRKSLEQQIRDSDLAAAVVLRGSVAHADVLALLAGGSYQVMILMSIAKGGLEEGIPVALLEGAQAGLVLLSSDSGAVPEFVHHLHNGFLLSSFDPVDDGVAAIERLLSDPGLVLRMRAQAFRDAQRYQAGETIPTLLSLLGAGGCC